MNETNRMTITDDSGNEREMEIILTFDSEDGSRHFVLFKDPAETEEAIQLIRKINESGVTILLIEHIMKAVVSLCEKDIVLHHGEKIAEGTPEQVMNDPYVMEVYLGTKKEGASA